MNNLTKIFLVILTVLSIGIVLLINKNVISIFEGIMVLFVSFSVLNVLANYIHFSQLPSRNLILYFAYYLLIASTIMFVVVYFPLLIIVAFFSPLLSYMVIMTFKKLTRIFN